MSMARGSRSGLSLPPTRVGRHSRHMLGDALLALPNLQRHRDNDEQPQCKKQPNQTCLALQQRNRYEARHGNDRCNFGYPPQGRSPSRLISLFLVYNQNDQRRGDLQSKGKNDNPAKDVNQGREAERHHSMMMQCIWLWGNRHARDAKP